MYRAIVRPLKSVIIFFSVASFAINYLSSARNVVHFSNFVRNILENWAQYTDIIWMKVFMNLGISYSSEFAQPLSYAFAIILLVISGITEIIKSTNAIMIELEIFTNTIQIPKNGEIFPYFRRYYERLRSIFKSCGFYPIDYDISYLTGSSFYVFVFLSSAYFDWKSGVGSSIASLFLHGFVYFLIALTAAGVGVLAYRIALNASEQTRSSRDRFLYFLEDPENQNKIDKAIFYPMDINIQFLSDFSTSRGFLPITEDGHLDFIGKMKYSKYKKFFPENGNEKPIFYLNRMKSQIYFKNIYDVQFPKRYLKGFFGADVFRYSVRQRYQKIIADRMNLVFWFLLLSFLISTLDERYELIDALSTQ